MKQRTRKFIGVILTFSWLVFYSLVMMAVGAALFGHNPGTITQFAFYVIAGMAWLPVAMLIIKWMARPDA